ncbi:cytochrome b5 reductase 4 isoform X2 [Cephus cinctus]|uniref:Cytochrome b5 reductase 4 isoform X2 n=2 Tax=Cephus cinctus TaxID=211228 RepID=A0AAJ7C3V7_CEPCN|nr:cytochrome b5 reductase 4 isoform X2 [Cephus cinctus]
MKILHLQQASPQVQRQMPRCCGAPAISAMDEDGRGLRVQDGNPRNKTALAPGHSLMDWIRLGSSGVDLTGVGGVPRIVTTAELAKHDKRTDAWIAIRGIVYNVTRYMDFHPGGIPELMKGVGKDATKLFENVHAWVNYQSILQKCVVGRLSKLSSGSTEKNLNSKSVGTSNTSSGLLSSCTKKNEESPAKNSSIVKMDWQQTSQSITFSYHIATGYHAVGYQLTRLSERKFRLILSFDKDIVTHELELNEDVNWPPRWSRNFETMDVDFTFTKKKGATWKTYGSCILLSEPKTKQRSYKDYEVISNTSLCENVNLLVLRANDYLELVPVGHHVEAKMLVMGMEVSRRYTPVPPCLHPEDMAPGYESDSLCLIVKRYPDGALSPSITSLKKSQTLTLSHALGTFVVENFDEFSTIHMLAAGTGLTAMLSIIQRALGRRNVTRMNLVCFNRNQANIFYSKQLKRVSNTSRLKVTHVLSQPDESWAGRRGTVSHELLKDLIGELSSQGCVFICGPEPFLKATREELQKLGWKKSQIHEFDD